jgi:hypothetical protein
MIPGRVMGSGTATSADRSRVVPFAIVKAERSVGTLMAMGIEARRWRQVADHFWKLAAEGKVNPQVARRAEFTEDVLGSVAEDLRRDGLGAMVVQARDGTILGAAQYGFMSPNEGMINMQAVAPENLPGSPGTEQLRGVGTALVAAVSRDLLERGAQSIWVKPLDQEAAVFWSRRGFSACGRGGLLCVRGRSAIEGLLGTCEVRPDSPADGEYIVCVPPGNMSLVETFA